MRNRSMLQQRPLLRTAVTLISLLSIVTGMALVGGLPMPAGASMSMDDVLKNGSFEKGFHHVPGCGMVGNGWSCFTNGGQAGYGFYDDEWEPVVADGKHSQLIEVNTKDIVHGDPDRYAGIYQTVKVKPHGKYKLNLRGMIRTTNHDGDPHRYVVEVGWTSGQGANWEKVENWQDVGWYEYYDRLEPGNFSNYTAMITAPSEHMTLYVRVWKKWGVPFEEIDVNLDAISLTGQHAMGGMMEKPQEPTMGMRPMKPDAPMESMKPMEPKVEMVKPMQPASQVACGGENLVYNGGFEHGFNKAAVGHVGRGWGSFTNGGAAEYGFYDEMWEPVVSSGKHGQLIEINTKGYLPADGDRYAGIYQKIDHLEVGKSYELVVRGMLRGDGGEGGDPNRFEAQVGYNWGHDANWQHVGNWTGMDLGEIYPRTEPGNIGTYRVRFKAEAPTMVLFLRGWLKWGETNLEFNLNLDDISVEHCRKESKMMMPMPKNQEMSMGMSQPMQPAPMQSAPMQSMKSQPMGEMGGKSCTYVVKPGDSLSAIAMQSDVSMQELMKVNNISNGNLIYIGQKLEIPGCGESYSRSDEMPKPDPMPMPEPRQAMGEPMKPEEPMMEPAHPSTTGLRSTKPGMEQSGSMQGHGMQGSGMQMSGKHTVRAGETLSGIASSYGVETQSIARANGLANANFIYVGQVLMIP